MPLVLAILPDLDVFARGAAHRGVSHSILFAVLLAVCGAGVSSLANRQISYLRGFLVLLGCTLVHPLLDYLMGCGPRVPFFWPLGKEGVLSPIQLVPTAYYARTPRGVLSLLGYAQTWKGFGLELLSLGPIWMGMRIRNPVARAMCLLVSLGGFAITWMLYN
jgi:inner membrane protein